MILAGGRGQRLSPLSRWQAKPAIRFGGMYRIIDFTLSNCLNSGIRQIYVLTQFASTSLERHIRQGWSPLFRSELGEFIESRPPQQLSGREWYDGTADSIFKNIDLVREMDGDGLLVLSGDHIYTMDYRKMIAFHRELGAEVTIASFEVPRSEASRFGVLTVDRSMRIVSFTEKPEDPTPVPGDDDTCLCSIGVYFFSRKCLETNLRYDAAVESSHHDLGRDVVPHLVEQGAAVYAYPFVDENRKRTTYWRDIGTIDALFEANMDLIQVDPHLNLYNRQWPIRTNWPQMPPAKMVFNWDDGRVGTAVDSLLSPGVILAGGHVERSVVSPRVRVSSYARVSDSILMDGAVIGRGATVHRTIVDHNVRVPEGARIGPDTLSDDPCSTISDGNVCVLSKRRVSVGAGHTRLLHSPDD
jgi:glucose-1-phosphate adenylyltransferase